MAVKLDLWLTGFAALMLLGASSSYRERALLPFGDGGEGETGLLGRELQEAGLDDIVSLVAPSGLRFLPDLVRQATGTPGSRRRSIAPLASGQPLTSSPEGSAPSGLEQANQATSGANPITGNQLALADSPPGGGTGGGGVGAGSGGAGGGGFGPGIGGGGGSPITTVSLLDPTDPTEGTPEPEVPVVPPVAAAIPEPGVWLLFLVGLFFSAAALRREASAARTQSV